MDAHQIVDLLAKELRESPIDAAFENEKEFERGFVEPACLRVFEAHAPAWEVAVHPWGDKRKGRVWAVAVFGYLGAATRLGADDHAEQMLHERHRIRIVVRNVSWPAASSEGR